MLTKREIQSRHEYTLRSARTLAGEIAKTSARLEECVRETGHIPIWLVDLEDQINRLKSLGTRLLTLSEVEHEGNTR